MNMNDAFVGSLIFNKNGGGGGASAMSDLTDVNITSPSEGETLIYDSTSEQWVNGQGGGKQIALTQAEYDALVQAGTVDPTVEYFITDGIPASMSATITEYEGVRASGISDGTCTIKVVDMGTFYIKEISGSFKVGQTISVLTEFTDLFTFPAEAMAGLTDYMITLAYGYESGFFFCRTSTHLATNAIACFYGTTADKWYSFDTTILVRK